MGRLQAGGSGAGSRPGLVLHEVCLWLGLPSLSVSKPAYLRGGLEARTLLFSGGAGVSPHTVACILPGIPPALPSLGSSGGECDVLWEAPFPVSSLESDRVTCGSSA